MKKESDAILLRIFIDESAMYEGKHLYKYLVEFFRKEGLAGATVLRGIDGFGKSSHAHTTSILRLSEFAEEPDVACRRGSSPRRCAR